MEATDGVRIPLQDQLWLGMDRPDNLMYINSIVWFEQIPDWDAVLEAIAERMVRRYPVFSRVPVRERRTWYWRDHPDFDLAEHVTRHRLGGAGDRAAAERYISERISVPMPSGRPLWQVEFIDGYHGHDAEGEGAILLFRVQHGMVDGVRLTELILGLCDHDADSAPTAVGRMLAPQTGGLLGAIGQVGRGAVRDSVDLARGVAGAALLWPWTMARVVGDVSAPGWGLRRVPTRVVESLSGVVSPTNTSVNTFRSVFRLVMEPRAPRLSWSGSTHAAKRVSWVTGLELEGVKRVARAHGSTVTAVTLAAVSLGLTEYLRRKGDPPVADVSLMLPVSLAPLETGSGVGDGDSDDDEVEHGGELGNHVTLLLLRLPMGIDDPEELLARIAESMTRVRHSFEPHVTFAAILTVAAAPRPLTNAAIDFFANKTVGQLTSVPGPRSRVSLGGTPVAGMLGWVPMSGDQPLGICLFSYAGRLSLGFATDAALVPDPSEMAAIVEEQFRALPGWDDDPAGSPGSR